VKLVKVVAAETCIHPGRLAANAQLDSDTLVW